MNGFSHAVRTFPRTAACVRGPLRTRRISRVMLVRPGASPHTLIRCRAHCKSRRGHNAEVFAWRLDFWGAPRFVPRLRNDSSALRLAP